MQTRNKKVPNPAPQLSSSEFMVDALISGSDGYPCYRIPALLRLPTTGLVMLFAEGRRGGDRGANDIIYKSSDNDGLSWSPLKVLHSEFEPPGHSWHAYSKNATFNATQKKFWVRDGFFDRGHDWVAARNMTLSAAVNLCSSDDSCFGFTFNDYDSEPPPTKLVNIAFKRAGVGFSATPYGWGPTIHNPCPVAVGGRALVVFARNSHNLLVMRALDDAATSWSAPIDITKMVFNKSEVSNTVPGPGAGVVIARPDGGQRIVVPLAGPFPDGHGGGAILSDDDGLTWRLSGRANPKGGEAQVALAPNGSLLLNSRGPAQGVRWQSVSDDAGLTWSAPRILDFGFGSSCEGSIVRVPDTPKMLFSHPGRVHNKYNRWNMTVWQSSDSGETWQAIEQVERGLNDTRMSQLHTAYSALLVLGHSNKVALAYERGPMPGSHWPVPSKCGEYATIRWRVV